MSAPRKRAGDTESTVTPFAGQVLTRTSAKAAPSLSSDESEWGTLIERIIVSDFLKRSRDRRELLKFLWANRSRVITAQFVEQMFYQRQLGRKASQDQYRAAMGISGLRKSVSKYAAREVGEEWHCEIPLLSESGTYGLSFTKTSREPETAARRFWKPHLDRVSETLVITGTHLFLTNKKTNVVLRLPFFRSKKEWDDKEILLQATQERDDLNLEGFTPWPDRYLPIGEVEAFDALAKFFHSETGSLISRKTARGVDIAEVRRYSPILFGRPQTNQYIEELQNDATGAAGVGYRIHDQQGTVRIAPMSDKERKDLTDFRVSPEGVISPVRDKNIAFGIVSRFPSPGGKGVVTVISSDYYSMLTHRLVESLTDDRYAYEILERAGWTSKPIPDTFEMLFTVRRFKGSRPDESFPTLVTCREG